VRQDQVTHMHRLSVYQNTVLKRKGSIKLYYTTNVSKS
jgi:hypothetical protein